jgi:drug/metabolite transporter (DMT)-like permease
MAPTSYIDIVGWIGSAAVVCAYALISLDKLNSRSRVYQVLNLVGSLGLVVNTAYYRAYPSTFVNIVWLVIAGLALVRIASAVRSTENPNFDSNTQV